MLGLGPLAEQVAVGVDDAARLAGGAGGEDDQRRVLGVHLLDRGRGLLRQVLVEDAGDVGHRHRRHPVGQLGQQRLLADAELRVRGGDPVLEVVPPQHRAARQRHRPHPPAGEQGQHPLDPVPDQRHHHVPALHPPSSKRPRESRRQSDQFAEVVIPPIPVGIYRDDPQPRSRRPLHQILDQIHGRESATALQRGRGPPLQTAQHRAIARCVWRGGPRPRTCLPGYRSSELVFPSNCRATISSWICCVPSKMSRIFASRAHFSSSSFSP